MDLNIESIQFGNSIQTPTGQLDMETIKGMLQSLAQKASAKKRPSNVG